MKTNPAWLWDESVAINKDFGDRAVVAAYDERHRRFRDVDGENAAILARLAQALGDERLVRRIEALVQRNP